MKSALVLGIMSGTSIDGVDYALCEMGPGRIRLRALWSATYPRSIQRRLHEAARGDANSWELAQLHHDLGRFYAARARAKTLRRQVAVVGVHGQTIFHRPSRKAPATFQLGEPAYLAEMLGVPVVSNFRAADLAAGGQGAPLATLFHKLVFAQRGQHVCVNNLGGISNVTSIDWRRGDEPRLRAFDTGPANVLLDLAARKLSRGELSCDHNGTWAAQGRVHEPLLREWLEHPFFRRKPPKSTGRELFGEPFLQAALPRMRQARLSRFDMLATFTALTARSLASNYRLHLPSSPDTVILTGGGAANPALRGNIQAELQRISPATQVQTSEDYGWRLQSIEPAAFALLAWLRLQGKPGNVPETTGARRSRMLGQITIG
jgi:anhydro-N-acetylmuramic acid kinase